MYEIADERQPGRRIKAEFTGQLRPEQKTALKRNAAVRYRDTKRSYSIWKNGCMQRHNCGEKSKYTYSAGIFVAD